MPEVGNDKNATVERGGFSAVQNALIGPEPKSSDVRYLVAIEVKADMPLTLPKDGV